MFLGGFAGVVYNINQVSLRQAITPERIQGRMNATMRFLVWGTIPIGSIIGGILGRRRSALRGDARGSAASLGCFAFVPILFSPVRSLETIPSRRRRPSDAELLDADAGMADAAGSSLD